MIKKILLISLLILTGQTAIAAYYKCPEGIIDTDRTDIINLNEQVSGIRQEALLIQIKELKNDETKAMNKYQCIKLYKGLKIQGSKNNYCAVYYDKNQNIILNTCIPAPSGKKNIPSK